MRSEEERKQFDEEAMCRGLGNVDRAFYFVIDEKDRDRKKIDEF